MSDEELRELLRQSGEETRHHFDIIADGLKQEIGTVAEAVVRLDQKVDRVDLSIRDEMQRGFEETQASRRGGALGSERADRAARVILDSLRLLLFLAWTRHVDATGKLGS